MVVFEEQKVVHWFALTGGGEDGEKYETTGPHCSHLKLLIDLHIHTNCSDGTDSPAELIAKAAAQGLRALAITDHDTFAGYFAAVGPARAAAVELVCGIEISTRLDGDRAAHLLAYFLDTPPPADFQAWIDEIQQRRRERNSKLALRLKELEIEIDLEEAEAIGRTVTGRLHFAQLLREKGYVADINEAFTKFIGEDAPAFVPMEEPDILEAIGRVRDAGGVPVLAHPVRLAIHDPRDEDQAIARLVEAGLLGLEVYHCDHKPTSTLRYLGLARKYGLSVTGGSDYHGAVKPHIQLGSGWRGNVQLPYAILQGLRSCYQNPRPVRRATA